MSRVFAARDVELGRIVVVKVLPPEMAAGVNAERFRREIQLAASLQHPHIVPLLHAGHADDLVYYTMPLIEGESLRARLAREGELPVPEVVRILRDVADALAYAHTRGVVHRDIKPDNVLISGHHAMVTDFGVAKAISEATGRTSLTSMGVALGTPAYMAPEQATADPHVDHRADLYALGALGYEMLTGRPPFVGTSPHQVLAAQVTELPDPVTDHRAAVPPALAALVMRCLEKKPADRWQSAAELHHQFEAMATPTGGMPPTEGSPIISSGTEAAIRRGHPARVATLFALAAVGVLALVYALLQLLGLPDWVLPGAIGLLAVGLPIMVWTGVIERRRALARTTGRAIAPVGLHRWFTWRRALLGGVGAFGTLGVGTAIYMGMRLLGIGPVGTLVASGVLAARDRLVLAEFENHTSDTTLGRSVSEAFRVDLAQSPVVRLLDPSGLADALQRMNRDRATPLDVGMARELAQREGVKAVVRGAIDPVGRGFVLSADLVSAADGAVLVGVPAPGPPGPARAPPRRGELLHLRRVRPRQGRRRLPRGAGGGARRRLGVEQPCAAPERDAPVRRGGVPGVAGDRVAAVAAALRQRDPSPDRTGQTRRGGEDGRSLRAAGGGQPLPPGFPLAARRGAARLRQCGSVPAGAAAGHRSGTAREHLLHPGRAAPGPGPPGRGRGGRPRF